MKNYLYLAQGDITRICADAVAVTDGNAFSAWTENFANLAHESDLKGQVVRRGSRDRPYWVSFAGAAADRVGNHPPVQPGAIVFVPPLFVGTEGRHPAYEMVRQAIDTAVPHLRAEGSAAPSHGVAPVAAPTSEQAAPPAPP